MNEVLGTLDAENLNAEEESAMLRLSPTRGHRTRAPVWRSSPLLGQRAGVLFFRRIDDLKRLVCCRNRRPERQKIPLVLGLAFGFDRERIGFLHQLMIPSAEIALAALQDVELRLFLEILDQLFGVGRFGFV